MKKQKKQRNVAESKSNSNNTTTTSCGAANGNALTRAFEGQKKVVTCGFCETEVPVGIVRSHRRSSDCRPKEIVIASSDSDSDDGRNNNIITLDDDDDDNEDSQSKKPSENASFFTPIKTRPISTNLDSNSNLSFSDVQRNGSPDFKGKNESSSSDVANVDQNDEPMDSPYYSSFFQEIAICVWERPSHQHLWTENDATIMDSFQKLKQNAQMLFVRLFLRKDWIPFSKLKYDSISINLTPLINEIDNAQLITSEKELQDLQIVLDLLPLSQLLILAKEFRLSQTRKREIIEKLLELPSKQRSLFGCSMEHSLLKRHTMLKVKISDVVLPHSKDTIPVQSKSLFQCRESLEQYSFLWISEVRIAKLIFKKDFTEVISIAKTAKLLIEQLEKDRSSFMHRVKSHPEHLRVFSAPWVGTRIVWEGVEALQKLKEYKRAVEWLWWLLREGAEHWCPDTRGLWWDRLALNLDAHLKEKPEALSVITQALKDSLVRDRDRFLLIEREGRLRHSLDPTTWPSPRKKKQRMESMDVYNPNETNLHSKLINLPTVTIQCNTLGKTLGNGITTVFFDPASKGSGKISVEKAALDHYLNNEGFTEGLHGEEGPWHSLLGLLLWEEVFNPTVDGAWLSHYQSRPLDMNTKLFHTAREKSFCQRLNWLQHASKDRLASSVGGPKLSKIFAHLIQDFRFRRSGFPDLVVWDEFKHKIKVVEVKGPGDKLSSKQRIWIDFFLSVGVDAEVCLVEGVNARKLSKDSA